MRTDKSLIRSKEWIEKMKNAIDKLETGYQV